jgi:hypothetical protein
MAGLQAGQQLRYRGLPGRQVGVGGRVFGGLKGKCQQQAEATG